MPHSLAHNLKSSVDREAVHLSRITEAQAGTRPAPDRWSQKEELGHLVDSAANNHFRFVCGSLQPEFRGPSYDGNGWVERHGYQQMAWTEIVDFWRRYNHFLAGLVARIPEDRLQTPCTIGNSSMVTLGFVIEDYILHMQHHLDHILRREKVTQYPGAAAGV